MAKRRTRKPKVIDTGLYVSVEYPPAKTVEDEIADLEDAASSEAGWSWEQWRDHLRELATQILTDGGSRNPTLGLLPDDATDEQKDASGIVHELWRLEVAPDDMTCAYWLGRLHSQLITRRNERYVVQVRHNTAALQSAAKQRENRPYHAEKAKAKALRRYESLVNRGMKSRTAYRQVQAETGISERTLKRHRAAKTK